jgi:MOSC domain-containing protein YiiM
LGKVLRIFIAEDKALPMQEVPQARAIPGFGLEGDRYAVNRGAWSNSKREAVRQVTLFSFEDLFLSNLMFEVPRFTAQDTRRNIMVTGILLNDLVGREFLVGEVRMRGIELCDPCERPSKLSGKPGFEKAFATRGGIRAEVLTDGLIRPGDEVV